MNIHWEKFHQLLASAKRGFFYKDDLVETVEKLVAEETQACLDLVLRVKKECQKSGAPTRVMICERIAHDIEKRLE